MAESKYGRLFTEADVREMLREYLDANEDIDDVLASRSNGASWTFPADEPLFLLRGQDEAAPEAIGTGSVDYASSAKLCGASDAFVVAVVQAAQKMLEWQRANPDRVMVPD